MRLSRVIAIHTSREFLYAYAKHFKKYIKDANISSLIANSLANMNRENSTKSFAVISDRSLRHINSYFKLDEPLYATIAYTIASRDLDFAANKRYIR